MSITFEPATISIIANNRVDPEPVRVEIEGIEAVGTGLGYHDTSHILGIYTNKKHSESDIAYTIGEDNYVVTHLPSGYGFPASLPSEKEAQDLITELLQVGLDWTQEKPELERDPLFRLASKIFHDFLLRDED